MNISVIIPSYKNPQYLKIALQSLFETQTFRNEVIVVIDGYPAMSSHIVDEYKDRVKFIEFDDNYGMPYALNIGVNNAINENILIINDDNVFCNKWDENLLKHNTQEKLVITPNQIEPHGPSIFDFIIKDFGTDNNSFDMNGFLKFEETIKSDKITNNGEIFPFFMSKKYYMAVGGFDLTYNSAFIVDWDFFLKLELVGMKFIRVHDVNFYHFGSKATKKNTDITTVQQSIESEQQAFPIFQEKWGFSPIRNKDNSHSPKNDKIRGITYE